MATLLSVTASAAAGHGIMVAQPVIVYNGTSGTTSTFTISNYDASYNYTISSTVGTPSRSGATITVTGVSGDMFLTLTSKFPKAATNTTTAQYASGGAAAATTVVISAANPNILIGQYMSGTGVAANTVVTNVAGTTITFSPAASSQISGTLTFSNQVVPGRRTYTFFTYGVFCDAVFSYWDGFSWNVGHQQYACQSGPTKSPLPAGYQDYGADWYRTKQ